MKFPALNVTLACLSLFGASALAQHHDPSPEFGSTKGRVLLVASSVNSLTFKDGRTHPTGYFLDELAVPAQEFIKAGYEVVVATPDGNSPALDANSINAGMFGGSNEVLLQALRFATTNPSMQKPKKLGDVVRGGLDGYDAVYVPGGHAPMVDLMQDKDFGATLRHFHANRKVTALLCHGPIALAAATQQPAEFRAAMVAGEKAAASSRARGWIYEGYEMTVYSTAEELPIEKFLGGNIQFYMEDALTAAGGKVKVGPPDRPFIVVDRELITGQNPSSDHMIAEAVLKKLEAQVEGRHAAD